MIKREDLKVGEKYKDLFGGIVKVLCIGEDKVFFVDENNYEGLRSINFVLGNWSQIPKQKKKLWIWDVMFLDGTVSRERFYMDEDGKSNIGEQTYPKEKLIKKHEDQFIEVEEA